MAHLQSLEGHQMEGKLPIARLSSQPFEVVSPYEPAGDQPKAIAKLAHNIKSGMRYETLLGVTGSGKTYTMAKTIEAVQKPTLVLAPNKTLAAQLAAELKEFFPNNAVVYFVSYYDYSSLRRMFLQPILLLKKMLQLMKKLKNCAMRQQVCYFLVVM